MAVRAKPQARPPHPGEILRDEVAPVLFPRDLQWKSILAGHLGVTRAQLDALLQGRANISPMWALRLGKVIGPDARHWMDLQRDFDLWKCEAAVGGSIAQLRRIPKPRQRSRAG